jgi:hypothetical protein
MPKPENANTFIMEEVLNREKGIVDDGKKIRVVDIPSIVKKIMKANHKPD